MDEWDDFRHAPASDIIRRQPAPAAPYPSSAALAAAAADAA